MASDVRPAGQRLQVAAQDDEPGQERGGFIKRGVPAAEAGLGPERIHHRDEVGGADPGGVEQAHVCDTAPQSVPGVNEELTCGAKDHGGGQRKQEVLAAKPSRQDRIEHPVVTERAQHDQARQRGRHEEVDQLHPDLVLARVTLTVERRLTLALLGNLIAEGADGLFDLGAAHHSTGEVDAQGVRRRIAPYIHHAG